MTTIINITVENLEKELNKYDFENALIKFYKGNGNFLKRKEDVKKEEIVKCVTEELEKYKKLYNKAKTTLLIFIELKIEKRYIGKTLRILPTKRK